MIAESGQVVTRELLFEYENPNALRELADDKGIQRSRK
jgi:hypothetical protein